jgi:hypothetical protein
VGVMIPRNRWAALRISSTGIMELVRVFMTWG